MILPITPHPWQCAVCGHRFDGGVDYATTCPNCLANLWHCSVCRHTFASLATHSATCPKCQAHIYESGRTVPTSEQGQTITLVDASQLAHAHQRLNEAGRAYDYLLDEYEKLRGQMTEWLMDTAIEALRHAGVNGDRRVAEWANSAVAATLAKISAQTGQDSDNRRTSHDHTSRPR